MMKLFLSAAVLALAARSTQAYGGSGTTSDACAASTDCEGYCDTDNRCYSCSLCAALNDALEGTCPSGCGTGTGTGTGNTYSCCNNAAILAGTCGSYAGSCGGKSHNSAPRGTTCTTCSCMWPILRAVLTAP